MKDIQATINELQPKLAEIRQTIHRQPELRYEEFETAKLIASQLEKLPGIEVETGIAKTGVVALLGRDRPGPCIALRADIDALPIMEETGVPYASEVPGKMHACGHDGHTASLLGAAMVLSEMIDKLPGPVKFIFQPAEELGFGGKLMCEEGVLEDPPVKAIFGLHGWPTLEEGTVGFCSGAAMAAFDDFTIRVQGQGTHAASPHTGRDPIFAAAHIILALQSLRSRSSRPTDGLVVSVTQFDAGTATNIIPAEATLRGTVRTLSGEVQQQVLEELRQIAENTAQAFQTSAEVEFSTGYPILINDDQAFQKAVGIAESTLGAPNVNADCPSTMGAEDFAYYLQKVPGTFWYLGLRPKGAAESPYLHSPNFDFNDEAIPTAVRLHCELALNYSLNSQGGTNG